MASLRHYLDFAVETAYQAGQLTLGYFNRGVEPEMKEDETPVTVADRQAEELMRRRIEKAYPEHGILGEEFEEKGGSGGVRWLLDPIDGTKSFVRGVPLYGVLMGLEIEGRVEVGVAYFPALGEMAYAATGEGCYLGGRRVRVAQTQTLAESTVSFTDVGNFERYGRGASWGRIQHRAAYRIGWSDAYGHMLVATGRAELMLDPVMNAWDCGPFPALLREAGGYFGDWAGNETIYGNEALSTTQVLLPEVLALLRGSDL